MFLAVGGAVTECVLVVLAVDNLISPEENTLFFMITPRVLRLFTGYPKGGTTFEKRTVRAIGGSEDKEIYL